MKRASPYICDYCGADKQAANHWWLRDKLNIAFILLDWDLEQAESEKSPGECRYEHICGETCAVKALSKWMGASR